VTSSRVRLTRQWMWGILAGISLFAACMLMLLAGGRR
jgi:hypothetical protein